MPAPIQVPKTVGNKSVAFITLMTLVAIAAVMAVFGLIASVISFSYDVPFLVTLQATAISLGELSVVIAILTRTWTYFRRGNLLCDCGPDPHQKLFRWLGILNLIPALFALDTGRRLAELAPVRQRIEWNLAQRGHFLNEAEQLLDEQRTEIRLANRTAADRLGHKAQTTLDQAKQLSEQINTDLAERQRLSNRILPDRESLHFAQQKLHASLSGHGPNLWETIASPASFQFGIGFMLLMIGVSNGLMSVGRIQFRKHGLWLASTSYSWKRISAYRWDDNGMLELTLRNTFTPLSLPIPMDQKQAVSKILAAHVEQAS